MIKSTVRFLLVLVLCLFGSGYALAAPIAYVHELTGNLQAQYGTSAPQALKVGSTIEPGGVLSTGPESNAVLKFEDGQLFVLQANTRFAVRQYEFVKTNVAKSNAAFELLSGGLRFVTGMIGATNKNAFKLTAGTATIGIRGSDGFVQIDAATAAVTAAVLDGALAITNALGTSNIPVGTFVTSTSTTAPTAPQQIALATPTVTASLTAARSVAVPINTPTVISLAADAAVKQAAVSAADRAVQAATTEPARIAAQQALDQARRDAAAALNSAVQAAQQVINQATQNGGVIPSAPAGTSGTPSGTTGTTGTSTGNTTTGTPTGTGSSGSGGGGAASVQ